MMQGIKILNVHALTYGKLFMGIKFVQKEAKT